jgi:hypothetical protein
MPTQTKSSEKKVQEIPQSPEEQSHEVKTLLEWIAPGRPFKKRTKTYYSTILVIMFFVEVILFLFSDWVAMLVVVSLVFLAFAFASVPPHDFHYRISTEGVFIEDHFSLWQELYDFYITKQMTEEVLIIRTRTLFPGELTLTNGQIPMEKIKSALLPYLPYREYITPTFTEKAGHWLTKNFPLEPVTSQQKPSSKVAS